MIPPVHWWKTVFVLIPVIGLYTIVLGTLSLLAGLTERRGVRAHRCAQWWARLILWTSGVRLERHGTLPPAGTRCVFVANHSSFYDIPILFVSVPRQLRIMAKATLGRIPFIGWHLHRAGHLLVDRHKPGAAIFKKMARLTEHGASLIVFPEAGRTTDGTLLPFKPGVFLLAIEHQLAVVPISIAGSRTVMPTGRLMVRPAEVRVTVHEPVDTSAFSRKDARRLAAEVREVVAAGV